MRKPAVYWLIAILAAAFALRLIFLIVLKAKWPGFDTPSIDALYHHVWAQRIAGGDLLSGGPFFRAPFYPYFLAALYMLFGTDFVAVFLIQILIGVGTTALTYFLARRLFDERIAILSAALVAINGVLIFFELQLLLDFLTPFFLLLILLFLIRARTSDATKNLFWAGLFCGLFAITRPNVLALIPLFVGWIYLRQTGIKSKIKRSLVFLAGAILIIAPVTARNLLVGGDFVLIASQGGINFYIGNNEQADGKTALLPGKGHTWQYSDAEFEAAAAQGLRPGDLKPSQVSDYFSAKAWKFIREKPIEFIKLTVKKTYLFWNYYEISNNNSLYFVTRYVGLTFIPLFLFSLIGPLGFVGAVDSLIRPGPRRLLGLTIFAYSLTVIAFFVTDRFRLPIVPLLTICASHALYEIVAAARNDDRRRFALLGGAVIFVGIFCWSDFYRHHDTNDALAHYSLGNVFLKKGDYDRAAAEYRRAIESAPCVPHAHTNLGVIAFYSGDTATARREFEMEINSCGPSGKAYNNLSLLKRLNHDYLAAYATADSAVKAFPNYREAYINLILAALAADSSDLIEKSILEFAETFPEDIAARYYHGYYLETKGLLEKAADEYRRAAEAADQDLVSEYDLSDIYSASMPYGYNPVKMKAKSLFRLGVLAAGRGDYEKAKEYFLGSLQLAPSDPDSRMNLALTYDMLGEFEKAIEQYDQAVKMDSLNPVYLYDFALTLGKVKRYEDAESLLAKAVALKPDFKEAEMKLRLLRQYLYGGKL